MIETILVGSDGSEGAAGAERFGVALAARLRVRLSGCTVVEDRDVRAPDDGGAGGFPEAELTAYYRGRADAISRRFAERARGESVEAACDSLQGNAVDKLVECAQGIDVAVLGRHGKSAGSGSGLIGSTLDGVLRKTSRSVIVAPKDATLAGPIVVGFDGSPGSRVAAKLAVDLANGLGESLHVFVDSKDKGRAVARFDEVRQLVGGLSVPVRENSSTLGRPDVKIIDAAKEAHASLIVMGAFGRNRISDLFLGSNAAAVARTSPVAVLLAR